MSSWRRRLAVETTPRRQRAQGSLLLTVKRRGDATVLDHFRQEGCLKARLPRPERGAWTTAVTLNSSGGVAQGDRLATAVTAGPGTRLTVTSQAAERFYRSPGGDPAQVRTVLSVAEGAALEWLPQETILFDACALDRRLEIDIAEGAGVLALETLVFGRTLMGEVVRTAALRDTIRLCVAGRLVLHDAIRLSGAVHDTLGRAAVAGGARAVATILHAGPDAAGRLDGVREALGGFEAGASVVNGVLVVRIVASDGACARAAIVAGLAALRNDRPPPLMWSC
jgi:urease accessory protein